MHSAVAQRDSAKEIVFDSPDGPSGRGWAWEVADPLRLGEFPVPIFRQRPIGRLNAFLQAGESIADLQLRDEILRTRWLVFELLTQVAHVDPDVMRPLRVAGSPNIT